MNDSAKPKVLVASYLEPEIVAWIGNEIHEVEVLYEPEPIGKPRYPCDHTSLPKRADEEEKSGASYSQWRM